jgi:DNA-binding response OmpR family regulator
MRSKILCVEGKYAGTPVFVEQLIAKGYNVRNATTGKDALAELASFRPQVAVVNAPSMRTTGVRICQSLREKRRNLPIVLIFDEGNTLTIDDVAANEVLSLPFTVRKLNNRIKALLPIQSKNCLKVGAIQLDLESHQVRCQGRKTHLTPRLMHLLQVLMREPGAVAGCEKRSKRIPANPSF